MAKQVTFASGLRPDWNKKNKEHPKKQTHVQISAGGLTDSDTEDVNPFPSSKLKSLTPTNEEVTAGAQKTKRDLSRRIEVNIYLTPISN
jgi:hypothetical protein